MDHSLLPPILRVLIVDDEVAANPDYSRDVKDALTAIAVAVHGGDKLQDVQVRCESDPVEGAHLWQRETFDLTLVDSDFSKVPEIARKHREQEYRDLFDLDARYRGALLFQLLHSLMRRGEAYSYRRGQCDVSMWTFVSWRDLKPILRITRHERQSCRYIAKRNGNVDWRRGDEGGAEDIVKMWEDLEQAIGVAVGRVIADKWSCEQRIERFVSFRQSGCLCRGQSEAQPRCDAFIVRADGVQRRSVSFLPLISRKKGASFHACYRHPGDLADVVQRDCTWCYVGTASRNASVPLCRYVNALCRGKCRPGPVNTAGSGLPALPLAATARHALLSRSSPNEDGAKREVPFLCPAQFTSRAQQRKGIYAAATPLTGVSTCGAADALAVLENKVVSLLRGPFEKVVLKTTYLDSPVGDGRLMQEWADLRWPAFQAQSHHRTRCWRSIAHPRTLWNTGITALEMLTPQMVNRFLSQIANTKDPTVFGSRFERLIISLGSKYPQAGLGKEASLTPIPPYRVPRKESERAEAYNERFSSASERYGSDLRDLVWGPLFDCVFASLPADNFQNVEINVRHFLREAAMFHFGPHCTEYMTPASLSGEKTALDGYPRLLTEFRWWLQVIEDVAADRKRGKKVILKFPFRSDLMLFFQEVRRHISEKGPASDSGIVGVAAINAYKAGVPEGALGLPEYSPAWYSQLSSWPDAAERQWKCQVSGELVTLSRAQVLGAIAEDLVHCDMQVQFGGGLVTRKAIQASQRPVHDGKRLCVQVGTWGLLNLSVATSLPEALLVTKPQSVGHARSPRVLTDKCVGCRACVNVCPSGAIDIAANKASIESSKCTKCFACLETCEHKAIATNTQWEESRALSGETSGASDKGNSDPRQCLVPPPNVIEAKCTGCTACATTCPNGAICIVDEKAVIDPRKCSVCLECITACGSEAIVADGLSAAAALPAEPPRDSVERRIRPRMAFLLQGQCDGCGKCSRSFYCDSFLDRQGEERPPVIDPRNCTGCGLCVQVCPRGALQMYDVRHFAVLLSGPLPRAKHVRGQGGRRDILGAVGIPHVAFDPFRDLDLAKGPDGDGGLNQLLDRAKGLLLDPNPGRGHEEERWEESGKHNLLDWQRALVEWAVALWSFRLEHDRFALPARDHLYTDARGTWLRRAAGSHIAAAVDVRDRTVREAFVRTELPLLLASIIEASVKSVLKSVNEMPAADRPHMMSLMARVVVWSQLLLSDPGQVYADSPIVAARTWCNTTLDPAYLYPSDSSDVKEALISLRKKPRFEVVSACIGLQWSQNAGLSESWVERESVCCKIHLTPRHIANYARWGFGVGRLAGLDVQAAPDLLEIEDAQSQSGWRWPSNEEQLVVAGVPWSGLRHRLRGILNEQERRLFALERR